MAHGAQENAQQHQHQRAPEGVQRAAHFAIGPAARRASEKGSATPTRNENEGWIRSCSEHPIHARGIGGEQRNLQKPLSGMALETRPNSSTSPIISNMTNPR